jgi:hypothetical protein
MEEQGKSSIDILNEGLRSVEHSLNNPNETQEAPLEIQMEREDSDLEDVSEAPSPKKPRTPYHKRIGELNEGKKRAEHNAKLAEQLAYQMANENDRLRKELEEKDQIASAHIINNLETRREYARDVARKAIELGDVESQIEAQELLSKFNSDLEREKNAQKYQEQAQPYYPPQNYMQPAPEPPANPFLEEFMDENPWFNQNSSEYDHRLAQEAVNIFDELTTQLKLTPDKHKIGTREFFNAAKKALKRNHGIVDEDGGYYEEPQQYYPPQRQNRQTPIAPVGQSHGSSYSGGRSARPVNLSSMEIDLAKRMIYKGNLSDDEKIKKYAEAKWQSNNPKGR